MLTHEDSAVLRRFKCSDCGKAFKFKHHLKVTVTFLYNILSFLNKFRIINTKIIHKDMRISI